MICVLRSINQECQREFEDIYKRKDKVSEEKKLEKSMQYWKCLHRVTDRYNLAAQGYFW